MANLIINPTREVTLSTETFVKGMWKVEIVHPNGEIEKPFGDEMRPNLLLTRGLMQLAGILDGHTTIASLMNCAFYGNYTTTPTNRDYVSGQTSNLASTTSDAVNGIFGHSSFSSVTANSVTTDTVNGSRTFTKVYDFLAQSYAHIAREILITDGGTIANQSRASGNRTGCDILSRFVLPNAIQLQQFQFLRLTYSLQVTIPAIVTPISIDVSSGSFSGLGLLKLVGTYNNIFGSMQSDGQPVAALYRRPGLSTDGDKPTPWCIIGQSGGTGQLMPGGNANGSTQVGFPAPNTNFGGTSTAPSSTRVGTGSGGSSINVGFYSNSNLSYTRGATLLFPATNPNITDSYIGGIFFSPIDNSNIGDSSTDYAGWYWRFTDGSGNPRGQLKDINFALAVNVQHTASIT